MEKIINKKLNNYLIVNNVIFPFQSGFRRGDSTVNQLLLMHHEFSKALDENKEIRIVFCDISRAFDRVWHKGHLFKLCSIGISENIIGWFKDYLSNRQQRVCIKGVASLRKFIKAGVPQGSILGPTLLLIYINDIIKDLRCNIRLFADDINLYVIVENPVNKAFQLNTDLCLIYKWAKTWLFDFHSNITVSLIQSRKRCKPFHPLYTWVLHILMNLLNTNIWDLYFSSDATRTEHIVNIVERAWKRIDSLRRNKFMLERLPLLNLYTTYIRLLYEYANIIWDNCSIENKRNLECIQIEAACIITGATKLCSIQKLYDDTGIQTLQKRRNNHKLFQLYKSLNRSTPQYLQSLIPQRVQNISRYQLRNMSNFNAPPARTASHANFYLPSTLRDWNSLDLIVRNSPTLKSFKRQLNRTRNENPYLKYFDIVHTSRSGQIYHSRLRLECSSLKHHLYTKSIVQDSRCSCGAIETTSHYLLSCDRYRNQWIRYLYLIPQPLSVPKLLFGIPEATTEENNFIFKQVQLYILATKRFAILSS